MVTEEPAGLSLGDVVTCSWAPLRSCWAGLVGPGGGREWTAVDGMGGYCSTRMVEIDGTGPKALERLPIREPLSCGIRALDLFRRVDVDRGWGFLEAVVSARARFWG